MMTEEKPTEVCAENAHTEKPTEKVLVSYRDGDRWENTCDCYIKSHHKVSEECEHFTAEEVREIQEISKREKECSHVWQCKKCGAVMYENAEDMHDDILSSSDDD